MGPNYWYVAIIFLNFVEVVVEYFVYKIVLNFPRFCLYYLFMKLFLFQSKTKNAVKDINQNFPQKNLNKKKSKYSISKTWFVKIWRLNWFLLKCLWETGARESKKCSPASNRFLWSVLPGSTNYFFIKLSDKSMRNSVLQNKSWISWK